MSQLFISPLVMVGIICMVVLQGGTIFNFIDLWALIVVTIPAFLFAMAGTKDLKTRVYNFADGAVLAAWIGLLIGAIMILNNLDFDNWQEALGPACAVMLLTVFYGHMLKAVCFLIAENLPEEKS
ncbi:MAG: hypothetical protein CMQ41_01385 [Gammaproteobacteria bacterium]|nr:hypothetical protein [Gammaproteobacteria bacterium]|tara:strand:+ start:206 stop:580 length:375 start_codon:yes stop_codon:yes gene_type:complete